MFAAKCFGCVFLINVIIWHHATLFGGRTDGPIQSVAPDCVRLRRLHYPQRDAWPFASDFGGFDPLFFRSPGGGMIRTL